MWTIIERATGETATNSGDPVLFDTQEQALAWADEHIDREQAAEFAIVDTESL